MDRKKLLELFGMDTGFMPEIERYLKPIESLPNELVYLWVYEVLKQGGVPNMDAFDKSKSINLSSGGMGWTDSVLGPHFWNFMVRADIEYTTKWIQELDTRTSINNIKMSYLPKIIQDYLEKEYPEYKDKYELEAVVGGSLWLYGVDVFGVGKKASRYMATLLLVTPTLPCVAEVEGKKRICFKVEDNQVFYKENQEVKHTDISNVIWI